MTVSKKFKVSCQESDQYNKLDWFFSEKYDNAKLATEYVVDELVKYVDVTEEKHLKEYHVTFEDVVTNTTRHYLIKVVTKKHYYLSNHHQIEVVAPPIVETKLPKKQPAIINNSENGLL